MSKIPYQKLYPYVGALVLFVVVAYFYFPPVLEGKVVHQADISSWRGSANEIIEYRERTGEEPLWTNSMFGGMPATMVSTEYHGNWLEGLYGALFWGPRPASHLILAFASFYFLLLAFGVRPWVAVGGALAYGFCAYNFQIIQVGHNAKMVAIAIMPLVLASVVYAFRRNRWLGGVLFGVTLAFEIMANHPQITFYLGMVVLCYGLARLYVAIREKAVPAFLKTAGVLVVAAGLGAGANVNHLWPTWEYTKYTMRGGSELTFDEGNQTEGGLDKDYATAWSYGVGETFNLLIPNLMGGSSAGELGRDSETYKLLKQAGAGNADQIVRQLPLYWGPQSFTAGPMYMGAVAIFLFVLGLTLVRGPMKWWVVVISVLAVLLAWGRHFMPLSSFFYDYVPLYNKFRVPSMILVILQLTIPLLGFYALNRVVRGEYDRARVTRGLKVAAGVTGGVCALFWLVPGLVGSFTSPADAGYPDWLQQTLPADRRGLLRADAARSLVFVVLSAGCVWAMVAGRLKVRYAVAGICALVVVDMWPVDKRYMNDGHFVTRREFDGQFAMRPVDRRILEDKSLDYRVLDLSVNTFNDSHTSYYHKTIGGYSAAKLQRYQDMIDYFIAPCIEKVARAARGGTTYSELEGMLSSDAVLNMLNTKYVIVDPNGAPIENRNAYGNAWFVRDYEWVSTPDEEILRLAETDPRETAVVSRDFEGMVGERGINYDDSASIRLVSYAPNKLVYETRASEEQLAVFSEVYYPKGWRVTVDGVPAEHFRADYILRAMFVPAGEHVVTFDFHPESYFMGQRVSMACSGVLLLALAGLVAGGAARCFRGRREEEARG